MTVPEWLAEVLPGHTAEAWEALAGILPADAYLGGGTAIAAHLQHRVSRDLDVFFETEPDLDGLEQALGSVGPTVTMRKDNGTLHCVFKDTKVQLLDASRHNLVETAEPVAGLRVAGLGDLMAMKLRAITDRGAHRDYFDLATIENDGGRFAGEGMSYFVARFEPKNPQEAVTTVLRSLGYLGDLEDDPAVDISVEELQKYWSSRLPSITGHLSRYGYDYPESVAEVDVVAIGRVRAWRQLAVAGSIGPHRPANGKCKARTKKRRRCPLDALPGLGFCGIHRRG